MSVTNDYYNLRVFQHIRLLSERYDEPAQATPEYLSNILLNRPMR